LDGIPYDAQNALTFQLTFRVPDSQTDVQIEAEMAWCTRDGLAGIKFVHLDDSSSTELKRWILQRQLEEGWTALK
jgi:hypothetical protein